MLISQPSKRLQVSPSSPASSFPSSSSKTGAASSSNPPSSSRSLTSLSSPIVTKIFARYLEKDSVEEQRKKMLPLRLVGKTVLPPLKEAVVQLMNKRGIRDWSILSPTEKIQLRGAASLRWLPNNYRNMPETLTFIRAMPNIEQRINIIINIININNIDRPTNTQCLILTDDEINQIADRWQEINRLPIDKDSFPTVQKLLNAILVKSASKYAALLMTFIHESINTCPDHILIPDEWWKIILANIDEISFTGNNEWSLTVQLEFIRKVLLRHPEMGERLLIRCINQTSDHFKNIVRKTVSFRSSVDDDGLPKLPLTEAERAIVLRRASELRTLSSILPFDLCCNILRALQTEKPLLAANLCIKYLNNFGNFAITYMVPGLIPIERYREITHLCLEHLTQTHEEIFDLLKSFPCLESLRLQSTLREFPPSCNNLKSLEIKDLKSTELRLEMPLLTHLSYSQLSLIDKPSIVIQGNLSSLTHLDLVFCYKISIPKCPNLQNLAIHHCGIAMLYPMSKLRSITLRGCTGLTSFPDTEMLELDNAKISECGELETFVDHRNIPNIRSLNISYCPKLRISEKLRSITPVNEREFINMPELQLDVM